MRAAWPRREKRTRLARLSVGIADPFDHPERSEVVDELTDGLLGDADPRREVGQPDSLEVEVGEQRRVRGAHGRPGRVRRRPRQGALVRQPRRLEQELKRRRVPQRLELAPLGGGDGRTDGSARVEASFKVRRRRPIWSSGLDQNSKARLTIGHGSHNRSRWSPSRTACGCARRRPLLGLRLTATMVVLRLADGSLLVYSPVALTPERRAAVEALGRVAHLYAPNLHHRSLAGRMGGGVPGGARPRAAGAARRSAPSCASIASTAKRPSRPSRASSTRFRSRGSGCRRPRSSTGRRRRWWSRIWFTTSAGPRTPGPRTYARLMGFYDRVALEPRDPVDGVQRSKGRAAKHRRGARAPVRSPRRRPRRAAGDGRSRRGGGGIRWLRA